MCWNILLLVVTSSRNDPSSDARSTLVAFRSAPSSVLAPSSDALCY